MALKQLKKYLSEPKQLIKLIVIIICICVSINQLYGCIKKLVHPPITTRYKFDLNETIRYPALTFCRRPAYKTALFPNYGIRETAELTYDSTFRHFPFKNTTIKQFLTATTYNLQELGIYGFGGQGMSDNVEKHSTFILSRGLCHTLIPKQNSATFSIAGGYLLYFKHDTMNTVRDSYGQSMSGFEIFLHDPNEIVTDPDEQINSFQEFIYLETSEDMHVRLMVEIFNQISTTNEPCVITGGYSRSKCQQNCLHRQIAAKARCTLPWLRLSDDSWPQCSDYQSVRTLITGFNPLNQSHFLKNCNCRMACNLTIYTSHIMTRRQADNLTRPGSIINLYFASNLIKQMDEAISYDFNLFLSDVGGSLGFFLGLSVIGILTIIEEIVQICSDDDKNRKNTKFFDYLTDYQTNNNKMEKY